MTTHTLDYYGGKTRHLHNLLPLLPITHTYVELFAGSAAVFFAKRLSRVNLLNDRDDRLVNLLRVIRDRPTELADRLALTPHARTEYVRADYTTDDPLELARQTLGRIRMGMHHVTAVRRAQGSDWSSSLRAQLNQFGRYADTIAGMAARLHHAQIDNRDALQVMARLERTPGDTDILIYADPPYCPDTRDAASGDVYRYEMTWDDHVALLTALVASDHRVAVSGYQNELYDRMLATWTRHEWTTYAGGNAKGGARTECLWCNYTLDRGLL